MISSLYIFLGLAPSIIWLLFYLRRDVHPEPKSEVIKVFFYGMLVALGAIFLERGVFKIFKNLSLSFYPVNFEYFSWSSSYWRSAKISSGKRKDTNQPRVWWTHWCYFIYDDSCHGFCRSWKYLSFVAVKLISLVEADPFYLKSSILGSNFSPRFVLGHSRVLVKSFFWGKRKEDENTFFGSGDSYFLARSL